MSRKKHEYRYYVGNECERFSRETTLPIALNVLDKTQGQAARQLEIVRVKIGRDGLGYHRQYSLVRKGRWRIESDAYRIDAGKSPKWPSLGKAPTTYSRSPLEK